MLFESTRGKITVSAAEAISLGMASDGGLFVPVEDVGLTEEELKALVDMTYQERALVILEKFLTDFCREELVHCINEAYNDSSFDVSEIAPLKIVDQHLAVLELWHGPTCAFKDMALQMLPHLLVTSARKLKDEANYLILVATSGDTGKAALEGFKDVPKTKILVFYPNEGVSEIQKLQMVTQEGSNVKVVAVQGNFDDTQSGVKKIFNDQTFKAEVAQAKFKLSSANSINWGRLVPQIIYYFSAYADFVKKGRIQFGEKINFVVPTGNFGNILAGFYARMMGLPINRLICAANQNNVLTDFIRTGVYDKNRPFKRTISPSMDILISSNLERLLYHLSERSQAKVARWMESLQEKGHYQVEPEIVAQVQKVFWSDYTSDEETLVTIKEVYEKHGYLLDPHTAVAWDVYEKYLQATGENLPTVIVSTASPFKFNASVAQAILGPEALQDKTEFELLELLASQTGMAIPAGLKDLDKRPIRHTQVAAKEEMLAMVKSFLTV